MRRWFVVARERAARLSDSNHVSQFFFTIHFTLIAQHQNIDIINQRLRLASSCHILNMGGSEMSSGKKRLEEFRIAGLPPDFYYIPNFITVEEETRILQKVRF